jgi:RHS repeat-associated protein
MARSWVRRRLLVGLAAVLVVGLVQVPESAAAPPGRPDIPAQPAPAKGVGWKSEAPKADPSAGKTMRRADKVTWPAAGATEVTADGKTVAVSGMPVTVTPAPTGAQARIRQGADTVDRVKLHVFDRGASARAGVDGPMFTLRRTDGATTAGTVKVQIGYQGFAHARGGDFGARLRLVALSGCAASTPEQQHCQAQRVLRTVNDTKTQTVSAELDVSGGDAAPMVFAMTGGQSSAQGDFKATELAPSSSWQTQLSSGGFTWNYPIRTPATPSGLGPQIALAYSSQAVDGRTAGTNNQSSWIGEGFSYRPGFIERRYKPCKDDGHDTSADQCWAFPNGTMVLAGRSGSLVKLDAGGNTWKLSNDDGSRIERFTGAANGDNDGEYWKVTTTDGTQYFFGKNRLPGWSAGKEETESAWTVPVYGDDANEPCNKTSGFDDSYCDQAWRWNLDYVIDPRGNVISYFYDRETNYFARGGKTDVDGVPYHRGGHLARIDYGQRHNQVYTTDAPARVVFSTVERCIPGDGVDCDPQDLSEETAASWPDVPEDLICQSGTHCEFTQAAPTFFTRKRLTRIETQVRGATSWLPVESWALEHDFKANDDASRTLWLKKITHIGHWGGADVTLPAIELDGVQLPNRIVKDGDNLGPLIRYRLATVKTDSGAQITINYKTPDCTKNNLPTPGESTMRCFPVIWNQLGGEEEDKVTDWFHKYVVDNVVEDDLVTSNDDMVTAYEYVGAPAWRKKEPDGITKTEDLTWSEWRGYQQVTVRTGNGQSMPGRVDSFFLRGMSGAKQPDGTRPAVNRTDTTGTSYTDHDQWSGHLLETIVYNGTDIVSKAINQPWRHVTHTQTETWGSNTAAFVRTDVARNLTALPDGPSGTPVWRETRSVTGYDTTWGRVTQVDDLGEVGAGKDGDDRCTRTSYVDNTDPAKYMYAYVSRTWTVSVNCGVANPNLATKLIADTRKSYDLLAWNSAPTEGTATRSESLDRFDGADVRYVIDSETTAVDDFGRALTVKDARAIAESRPYATSTEYTDTYGLTTQVKVTNALGHIATTVVDPAYAVPTSVIDANLKRTDLVYDAFGRLTGVWLADRDKAQGATPSIKYTYALRNTKTTAVTTEEINNDGTYRATHELFDGMMRPRQTQTPGPGGWLLTDTFHNGSGKAYKINGSYLASGVAGDAPIITPEGAVNGQSTLTYDQAGRAVTETFSVAGDARWVTTATHEGDRVHIDPADGGVPTTRVTDARGRTIELHQYEGSSPTGPADVTHYTYTPTGSLDTITDPAGNIWDYDYNQRNHQTLAKDPDVGDTQYTYNTSGDLTSITDARNIKMSNKYDALGRKTETWQGDVGTGTKRAAWVYDNTGNKGQLHYSQRIVGGQSYYTINLTRDSQYRPTKVRYSFPSGGVGTQLGLNYEFTTGYNTDGTIQSVGFPAAGGLAAEAVAVSYDNLLRPTAVTGSSTYVTAAGTRYGNLGELLGVELYTGTGTKTWLSYEYERGTNRLTRSRLDRQNIAFVDRDAHYDYDDAGNVMSIADTPSGGQTDIQCFGYDHLRRLTEAWAHDNTSATCGQGVSATGVGGPAPYHHSWTFEKTGIRNIETVHSTTGGQDTVRDYSNPADGQGQNQPHTLTRVDETGPNGNKTYAYRYDEAGNTVCRPNGSTSNTCTPGSSTAHQSLTWDPEGHLDTSTPAGGQATSYVYDADGNRIVRKEPGGLTTLYLPGMELALSGTVVSGTRYYTFAGQTVATRTTGGVYFHAADHHGTAGSTVNAATGAITWRRTTPYGTGRGTPPPTWPNQKGFIGGTQDPTTGLTHLGAREYDATTGRFISVDPIMDLGDPQQWNGYSYSNNNPTTFSDPSGLTYCLEPGDCVSYAGVIALLQTGTCPWTGCEPENPNLVGEILLDTLPGFSQFSDTVDAYECAKNPTWGCVIASVAGYIPWVGLAAKKCAKKCDDIIDGVTGNGKKNPDAPDAPNKPDTPGGTPKPETPKTPDGGPPCKKCKCNSFDPNTEVLLADGTTKKIKDVVVGDKVIATDPLTGVTEAREVTRLHLNQDRQLTLVTVVDGTGARYIIDTTWEHPFWSTTRRDWVPAAELRAGEELQSYRGGPIRVVEVKNYLGAKAMHNLTVAGIHTYYVIAGGTAVLVHNDGELVDPNDINFSQRTISSNNYAELMKAGKWNWARSPLRVMDVDGQLVSYDNRRLDAAREAGEQVLVERVNPSDPHPDSTTGKTWAQKFAERFRDPRNVRAGGVVPSQGLPDRPEAC